MTSVTRSPAQTLSRSLLSDACYYSTYSVMQSVFSGTLGVALNLYSGAAPIYKGNLILFANDTDLGAAIQALERYCDAANDVNRGHTDAHITLRDLGKKIHLGVQGGSSSIFTYNLVQITQGSPAADDRTAVFVLSSTETLSSATYTALTSGPNHFGLVFVGRG